MKIERLEVEGGFLHGLDLAFAPGFNVVMGPRGSGKTSIIELIRFTLDLPFLSEKVRKETREQALAVLEDGTATVTYSDGDQRYRASRSAGDKVVRVGIDSVQVLVLAQNEIEGLGTSATSRLRLIDGFVPDRAGGDEEIAALRSIEAELAALRQEVLSLDEQLASYSQVAQELVDARASQKQIWDQRQEVKPDESVLENLNKRSQQFARAQELLRHFEAQVVTWRKLVRSAADATPATTSVFDPELFPRLASQKPIVEAIRQTLDTSLNSIVAITEAAAQDATTLSASASNIDALARPIRAKLEAVQRGAGEVSRRITALEKRIAQGQALAELRTHRAAHLDALRMRRAEVLDRIEDASATRSLGREQAAAWLSKHLRPSIRVDIAQRANLSEYVVAITKALRGTGMHAGQLADQVASRISPRQLVEVVENGDKTSLSRIVQITPDRAQRLINALMSGGTSELVGVSVDDDAQISLLVGPDYRRIEKVSTGQRCTAIIPILLSRQDGCLIIDQPEDHLDNAYIVDTLVAAINDRRSGLQVIFSTHNANLPVLGEADRVIEMASDGMHGYCKECGKLDDPAIVSAITTIMEGGADAFKRRAEFYHDHSKPSQRANEP